MVTTSTGQVARYQYLADPDNGTTGSDAQYLQCVSSPDGTISYSYVEDATDSRQLHALASITHSDGTHSFFCYDSQGRLQNEHGDNDTGSVTFSYFDPGGYTSRVDATGATTTVFFDESGRTLSVKDASNNIYQYIYDSTGNLIGTTLPDGSTVDYGYDSLGSQTSQTNLLGTTTATYNQSFGTLSSFTDANHNLTTYSTDDQGDLTSITAADSSTTQFVPDPAGEVQQLINARGQSTIFSYNSFGEVQDEDFGNGVHTSYTYNGVGNLLTATNASGTTAFDYGDATFPNLPTSVTDPTGLVIAYGYDGNGRLDQMNQDGYIVNYSYDASGRLATMTDGTGLSIAKYQYDDANELIRKDLGNGTYTTYTYTATGQVQSLVNDSPTGTVNSEFSYTYDDLGRVETMTTLAGITMYGYDAIGQLSSVTPPGGKPITYGYDAMGNRTTVTQNGVTSLYTTNDLNQYTAASGALFTYDEDGNLKLTTGSSGTTRYTFNVQNQLVEVQTATDTWAYTYDALGDLIATTHNGETSRYLVNPGGVGSVLGEYDSAGNVVANYTAGLGLTSRVDAAGNTSYYDFDAQGSTADLTGVGGGTVDSYSYLPFGEVTASNGSVSNPFQYVGQAGVMSDGNGLDFMRARFYSPAVGRFISEDPAGYAGGINLYSYAANNPTSLVDPAGLAPENLGILIGNGIRAFVGGGVDSGFALADTVATDLTKAEQVVAEWAEYDAANAARNAAESAATVFRDVDPNPFNNRVGEAGGVTTAAFAAALNQARAYAIRSAWAAFAKEAVIDLAADILLPIIDIGAWFAVGYEGAALYNEWPSEGFLALYRSAHTVVRAPEDPNFIAGPVGYGSPGFVTPDAVMPYTIGFENAASASAPAQVVSVTQQLDPSLDWSTFQLGSFGFGGQEFAVPAGRTSYSTRIDARSTVGVYVDVDAEFDSHTGLVTWTFTSIDPTTFGVPVGDPTEGFLPPDVNSVEGQGFVSYTVDPIATDITGTTIDAQATVFFQAGLPSQTSLNTASILNTVDAGSPTSSIGPLPRTEPSSNFSVTWSGEDDPGGSGIASYDVYVSDNGGPFTALFTGTTQTSTTYTGQAGNTYDFYSVASDNVGNVQATPTAAQATTLVPPALSGVPVTIVVDGGRAFSGVIADFTDPNGAQAISNYSATIDWGDGSDIDTHVTLQAGGAANAFNVLGDIRMPHPESSP